MNESQPSRRVSTLLWFALAAMTLGNQANAHFAKVKGSITDTSRVKVVNSSVRLRTPNNGPTVRVANAPEGDYLVDDVVAGKYELIACGLPFRPTHKTVTIPAEQLTTINLVLDEPHNAPKITLAPEHIADISADGILYLKDAKSGCPVAQARPNSRGEYEFTNWQAGDDVCVRRRLADKGGEEYVCFSTLTVSP